MAQAKMAQAKAEAKAAWHTLRGTSSSSGEASRPTEEEVAPAEGKARALGKARAPGKEVVEASQATDRIEWKEALGYGSFGAVHRIFYEGQVRAAKRLDLSTHESHRAELEEELAREFRALEQVSHPNIISLLGVVRDHPEWICLVMELADKGSLRQMLDRAPGAIVGKVPVQISLAHDIASGLAFCHSMRPRPVLHSDIKSTSILLFSHDESGYERLTAKLAGFGSKTHTAKLAGFGSKTHAEGEALSYQAPETYESGYERLTAKLAGFGSKTHTAKLAGFGSKTHAEGEALSYQAPETFSGQYTTASEVYSFAIVLLELLTGQKPWHHDAEGKPYMEWRQQRHVIYLAVSKGKRPELPSNINSSSKLLVALMRRCWNQVPKRRPSFDSIVAQLQPHVLHRPSLSESMAETEQEVERARYEAPIQELLHNRSPPNRLSRLSQRGLRAVGGFGVVGEGEGLAAAAAATTGGGAAPPPLSPLSPPPPPSALPTSSPTPAPPVDVASAAPPAAAPPAAADAAPHPPAEEAPMAAVDAQPPQLKPQLPHRSSEGMAEAEKERKLGRRFAAALWRSVAKLATPMRAKTSTEQDRSVSTHKADDGYLAGYADGYNAGSELTKARALTESKTKVKEAFPTTSCGHGDDGAGDVPWVSKRHPSTEGGAWTAEAVLPPLFHPSSGTSSADVQVGLAVDPFAEVD